MILSLPSTEVPARSVCGSIVRGGMFNPTEQGFASVQRTHLNLEHNRALKVLINRDRESYTLIPDAYRTDLRPN